MYVYNNYLPFLIYSLFLTISLEVLFSMLLGLKKIDLLNVFLANLLTNPLINCIHPLFLFKYGKNAQTLSLIILEIIVLFAEGFIYKKTLKYNKLNPFFLSFILNFISFTIGLVLNYFIF